MFKNKFATQNQQMLVAGYLVGKLKDKTHIFVTPSLGEKAFLVVFKHRLWNQQPGLRTVRLLGTTVAWQPVSAAKLLIRAGNAHLRPGSHFGREKTPGCSHHLWL